MVYIVTCTRIASASGGSIIIGDASNNCMTDDVVCGAVSTVN